MKEIENAFIKGIPLVSWMDDKTRETAIEKVRKIVQMIGYPDWILDSVQLDKYYENVRAYYIISFITLQMHYKLYVSSIGIIECGKKSVLIGSMLNILFIKIQKPSNVNTC